MRIALLIDSLAGGGSEGVALRLAKGLASRGHRVFVHCLKAANVEFPPIPGLSITVHGGRRLDVALPLRLMRRFRADRIDLVHAHSCSALCVALPAARWLGVPIVHVRHGWTVRRKSRYAWLSEKLTPLVTRIVVNSASGRARLPAGIRDAAVHIANGLDVEPVTPPVARAALETICGRGLGGPIVLSVANIRPEKDPLTLLHAFAILRKSLTDATLVCVGGWSDDVYQRQVLAERDRLGLQKAAHFVGAHTHAHRLMPGADVLCLSSCTESMPNAILEAMAHRVPIVATAVGDVGRIDRREPEYMLAHGESALLAEPGDASGLAAALHATLGDRSAARIRAGRAHARYLAAYSASQMLDRYERLYTDCVAERSAAVFHGRARPAILMVGPAAPQVGGMVTSIDTLLGSPLRHAFRLHRFATVPPRRPAPPVRGASGRLRLFATSIMRTPIAMLRHVFALARLAATIVFRRIDIVHIHTCSFGTYYRSLADLLIAQLLGRRIILHIRGGRFSEFVETRDRFERWVIRATAESADRVVVLGDRIAAALRPLLGNARISVVPNGVPVRVAVREPRRLHDHDDHGRTCRFLFLGEISIAKGAADLLDAATQLRESRTPFELTLAGPIAAADGTLGERLRAAARDGLVTLVGPVDRRRRDELLRTVDCVVHPSHSEAMPNVILEAGAAGVALIATAVGCVPEMLGACSPEVRRSLCVAAVAPLVQPRDSVALADAMRTLAVDESRRQRIGKALQDRIRREYSDSRLAERVSALYRDVLGSDAADAAPSGSQPEPKAQLPVAARMIGGVR